MAAAARGTGPAALSDVLAARGLAPLEVRTYEALMEAGTAAPTTIAHSTGQSRARAYDVLRHLVKAGLAFEEPTRPVRFRVVPLADVLNRTIAELASHQKILQDLQSRLPDVPPTPTGSSNVGIKNLSVATGRKGVLAEIRRMVRSAHRLLYIGGGGQLGNRLALSPDLVQELRQARKRNVDVRLHFLRAATLAGSLDALEDAVHADSIRWVDPDKAVPIGYAVNENVAMIIIVQPDDGAPLRGDDLGIRFESLDMVETISRRLTTSEEPPPVPAAAPTVASPGKETIERRFVAPIQAATTSVLGMGPPGWTDLMLKGPPGRETLYAEAKKRGVHLRASWRRTPSRSPRSSPSFPPGRSAWPPGSQAPSHSWTGPTFSMRIPPPTAQMPGTCSTPTRPVPWTPSSRCSRTSGHRPPR